MKVLVVDDDEDFRSLTRALIQRSFPRAAVAEYDPESRGVPLDDFPWADYDVVLLDHELNTGDTGLDWLRRYGRLPGFPAVIFATGAGDENLAARAMKFGADEYLSKRDVSAAHLGALLSSVMAARNAAGPDAVAPVHDRPMPGVPTPAAVPGYSLRRLLGCGGTADVYLAERHGDGLTVVLKLLREGMAHNAVAIKRLVTEARVLESLDSPHVVKVYGHGVEAGRAYLAMEYLGHGDLRARISEGLGVRTALEYALALARGLATVHARGVLHRDIKPGNVMYRYDDSLALTDFGIAKSASIDSSLTGSGSVVGTPSYMSPEQCEGRGAEARSDLYSLGVVIFEMLTGSRPFTGDSPGMLFMQHVTAAVPRLPEHLSHCQALMDGLLAKRPQDRPPHAGAVAEEIAALLER